MALFARLFLSGPLPIVAVTVVTLDLLLLSASGWPFLPPFSMDREIFAITLIVVGAVVAVGGFVVYFYWAL